MPFQYERDDGHRRVVVTFAGPFQTSEMLAAIARHHGENAWDYGVLIDVRGMTGQPSIETLRLLMRQDEQVPPGETGPRGAVAILVAVTDLVLYKKACTYAALGRPKLRIDVFCHRDEAELWLAA